MQIIYILDAVSIVQYLCKCKQKQTLSKKGEYSCVCFSICSGNFITLASNNITLFLNMLCVTYRFVLVIYLVIYIDFIHCFFP